MSRGARRCEAALGRIPFALVAPAVEGLRRGSVEERGGQVDRRSDRAGLPVGVDLPTAEVLDLRTRRDHTGQLHTRRIKRNRTLLRHDLLLGIW